MERCAVGFVKPVAGVQRQKFYFRSVWQIRRLVHDKSTFSDTRFNSHAEKRSTWRAVQQELAADGRPARSLASQRMLRVVRLRVKPNL